MSNDIYNDGVEHPCLEIDTPFLITKDPKAPDKNEGQAQFQRTVDDFLADVSKNSLVVRSRYGSGKTTFHAEVDTGAEPGQGSLHIIHTDVSEGHDEELQALGV